MKNFISICFIFIIIYNPKLLKSQEYNFYKNNTNLQIVTPDYLSVFDDGYAVIGFKKSKSLES